MNLLWIYHNAFIDTKRLHDRCLGGLIKMFATIFFSNYTDSKSNSFFPHGKYAWGKTEIESVGTYSILSKNYEEI